MAAPDAAPASISTCANASWRRSTCPAATSSCESEIFDHVALFIRVDLCTRRPGARKRPVRRAVDAVAGTLCRGEDRGTLALARVVAAAPSDRYRGRGRTRRRFASLV